MRHRKKERKIILETIPTSLYPLRPQNKSALRIKPDGHNHAVFPTVSLRVYILVTNIPWTIHQNHAWSQARSDVDAEYPRTNQLTGVTG